MLIKYWLSSIILQIIIFLASNSGPHMSSFSFDNFFSEHPDSNLFLFLANKLDLFSTPTQKINTPISKPLFKGQSEKTTQMVEGLRKQT